MEEVASSKFYPWNPKVPKEIVRRHENNPILTGKDFPGDITWVFNCGIVKHDGKYVMVCRVEDSCLNAYLWIAESDDGYYFIPRVVLEFGNDYRNKNRGKYPDRSDNQ